MLIDDFRSKVKDLPAAARAYWTVEAMKECLEPPLQRLFFDPILPKARTMDSVDIAIVTIKPPELRAAKLALGIPDDETENDNINGLRFWKKTTPCKALNGEASVILTMIGEQGNATCASACGRIFQSYNVGLCVLVGIAAGVKDKVQLGDCVAGELILDYEHARVEPGGVKKRPRPFEPPVSIGRDLQHFEPGRLGWLQSFQSNLSLLAKDPYDPLSQNFDVIPNYEKGVILSGEKLIADGSLPDMQAEYHERVRALEMEGAGFGRSCREYNVPWLVFRGISDYGDPEKGRFPQVVAALSAVTAMLAFIRNEYRKEHETF